MTAISEREAKTQYVHAPGGILAYSLKVASTYIRAHFNSSMGQAEALAARKAGTDVHLIVRHPLDRLVSGWAFWTKKANSHMSDLYKENPTDHDILFKESTLEEWFDASTRHYNDHWEPQARYHSRDGELVPNILWPLESLSFMPATNPDLHNKSPRESTEHYFKDKGFRKAVEDYYAADIELYEKSKEMWNGREAPSILCGSK